MAKTDGYSGNVAARTRAAQTVLEDPQLLETFEKLGGLREDLEQIAKFGHLAEAANLGQSTATAAGVGATADLMARFDAIRTDYQLVMGVAQAVKGDLARTGATAETLAALDQIIVNEVPVRIVAIEKEGTTKKKARKVESLEAIRAEIHKDATALLGLKEALAAFARRKVDEVRLKALVAGTEELAGKLGERAAKKGAAKAATQAERDAVNAQKDLWSATYRILASVGRSDPRVAQLLTEATGR